MGVDSRNFNRRYLHKITLELRDKFAVDVGEVEKALIYLVLDASLYESASRCYKLCLLALHFGRYYILADDNYGSGHTALLTP